MACQRRRNKYLESKQPPEALPQFLFGVFGAFSYLPKTTWGKSNALLQGVCFFLEFEKTNKARLKRHATKEHFVRKPQRKSFVATQGARGGLGVGKKTTKGRLLCPHHYKLFLSWKPLKIEGLGCWKSKREKKRVSLNIAFCDMPMCSKGAV